MISTNDFKTGMTIEYEGNIYSIIEFQHVKPGKGGAFVRTKLRNLRTRAVIDKTFNAGINIEQAIIDKSAMQYLYASGDTHVFMNQETFEQIEIHQGMIENELYYLTEGMTINIIMYNHEILGLELPDKVTLEVIETAGGAKGNTASNATKEALTNTGLRLLVPLFVETGEKIVVSTATGKYDTRAK
ncbi:MAG: elongation factor P [Candidatus Izemoplasmatales bacterium]|jgi:elongation factor P|nr:elongation factor P [Candidatus Izemoplasmatales bacterium]MDD4987692.1 elongation factor P [Candidatus Izemoplasmatales bacterium]MDD5601696.1 elongation factor P [Candidatus Izemoplasmatales bacterium]MDY0372755.1 elongation factor P [Candidatus Izemoplasmatales bacterium]NLF48143.1 elongation factor P [Acholeplasmataceae bacterium]